MDEVRHRTVDIPDSQSFPSFSMLIRWTTAINLGVLNCFLSFRSIDEPTKMKSIGFKARFVILETVFVLLVVCAVPIGAHGTVVAVSIANLLAVAWFWYNHVRSVDVTSEGTLRFWIGNIEVEIPFDKVISIRRVATASAPCSFMQLSSVWPYRGFLSDPYDGVAVVTTVPSTPFWLWPRSAGKPERSFCFGYLYCPRLTVVFSPTGGGQNFINDVEREMLNFSNGGGKRGRGSTGGLNGANPDLLDV